MNDTNLVPPPANPPAVSPTFSAASTAPSSDFLVALSEFDRTGAYRRLGFANLFDYLLRELKAVPRCRPLPEDCGPAGGRGSRRWWSRCGTGGCAYQHRPAGAGHDRGRTGPRCCRSSSTARSRRRSRSRWRSRRRRWRRGGRWSPRFASPVNSTTSPVHPGELLAAPPEPAREPARTVVEPLTSTVSRIHVTVSRALVAKLKRARAGQSHVQPGATDEQVIDAALDLLLAQQEKRRASVPPRVKREVRRRDAGQCQWKLDSGGVCGSEVRAEIDHVVPRGRGGPSTVDNCRVLCDVHNREAARQVYGDAHMDLFTRGVPHASEPVAEWGGAPRQASVFLCFPLSRHILRAGASIRTRGFRTPTRNRRAP